MHALINELETTMFLNTVHQKHAFTVIRDLLTSFTAANRKRAPSKDLLYSQARILSNLVWELPKLYTGKASEFGLVALYNMEVETLTPEHLWPRQFTGTKLIEVFTRLGRVDEARLMKMLEEFCAVNRTLAKENVALKKYQGVDKFVSPQRSYKNAGIKLLRWPNGARIETLPVMYPHLKPSLLKGVRKGK
jgi:hypothetical protein